MPTLVNVSVNDNSTWTTYLDMIYPIGSYYLSNNNTSPSNLFGGSWVQINDSRYLLPKGYNDLGGSYNIGIAHLPPHTHNLIAYDEDTYSTTVDIGTNALYHEPGNYSYGWKYDHLIVAPWDSISAKWSDGSTGSYTGGGQSFFPAYRGVYCWYRTA